MFPYNYLVAVALIYQPADPDKFVHIDHALNDVIQDVAIEMEIWDPRENRAAFSTYDSFNNLNLIRQRRVDLVGAPALCMCERYPARNEITNLLNFNLAYRCQLSMEIARVPYRFDELKTAQQQAEKLHLIWDTIRDSRCEYYYIYVRRLALRRVVELIGEDEFYNGHLPPFVPCWQFREIR